MLSGDPVYLLLRIVGPYSIGNETLKASSVTRHHHFVLEYRGELNVSTLILAIACVQAEEVHEKQFHTRHTDTSEPQIWALLLSSIGSLWGSASPAGLSQ